jgi:hypothetical protein
MPKLVSNKFMSEAKESLTVDQTIQEIRERI